MKKAFLFLITVLLIFVSVSAFSQTVEEIIAKNLQAKGGIEKLKSVKSIKMVGKVIVQEMGIPQVIYWKRPNLMRRETDFQGQKMIIIFDGEKAWRINPLMGSEEPMELTGAEAELVKEHADFDGPFVDYKEKGIKIELSGKEEVEGTPVYKLKITTSDGKEKFYYLEINSCLEIKTESTYEIQGNSYTVINIFSDYREVDGLKFPFSIQTSMGGINFQFLIEAIELNPELDDSLFKVSK